MPNVSGRLVFDSARSLASPASLPGIANVPIVLQDTTTLAALAVLTDANGNYSFTNVPSGSYQIVEYYGYSPVTATPGDFTNATADTLLSGGVTPPISYVSNPPSGATNIDCLSSNTLLITVSSSDVVNNYITNGPVKYTPFGNDLDSNSTILPGNLLTAADDGTFGSYTPGTATNTMPSVNPYPDNVGLGFTYVQNLIPPDGSFTIVNTNIAGGSGYTWWRLSDHTTGNETGRVMFVNGANPNAVLYQDTVNVKPNTYYLFSTWILNLIKVPGYANPALGVRILDENSQVILDQTLGQLIPMNPNEPEWVQIGSVIYSAANTQITVMFVSQGPAALGNDYAIDDISLYEAVMPKLTPEKTCSTSQAVIGDVITYTIALKNTFDRSITAVEFTDLVPSGLAFVTGTVIVDGALESSYDPNLGFALPDVASGETVTVTFDAKVQSIPPVNPIPNVASISYDYQIVANGVDMNYTALSTIPFLNILNFADLAIVKTGDLNPVTPGETLTYTLLVTNNGPDIAPTPVVTDNMSTMLENAEYSMDNGVTWNNWSGSVTLPDLANGATATAKIRATIAYSATGSIENIASVDSSQIIDPDPSNNTSTITTTINQAANLSIVKTANTTLAIAGELLTYTLTVKNAGPSDAENVAISDDIIDIIETPEMSLDNGITWSPWISPYIVGLIPNGDETSLLIRGMVNPSAASSISNTATVTSDTPDPNLDDNIFEITTPVSCLADISMIKTEDANPVLAGDELTYSLLVTNNGPSDAVNVIINDVVPTIIQNVVYSDNDGASWHGWNGSYEINSLSGKSSVTILIKGTLSNHATGNIINTATATSDTPDSDLSNNSSYQVTLINTEADLRVTKTASKQKVRRGDTLTYTIVVENLGPTDAQNVTLTDILPVGLNSAEFSVDEGITWREWNNVYFVGLLEVNADLTIFIRGKVTSGAVGVLSNTAYVASITPDPNPMNNFSTTNTLAPCPHSPHPHPSNSADLAVIKVACSRTVKPCDNINYTIVVTNNGPATAKNAVLKDELPNEICSAKYSLDRKEWHKWENELQLGDMPPNTNINIFIEGTVRKCTPRGEMENIAHVHSDTEDPNLNNNHFESMVQITPKCNI